MSWGSVAEMNSSDQLSSLSDRELVKQFREGNDQAATQLYGRYADRLRGLAFTKMSADIRKVFEPDDIVQSAFRSLFRGVSAGSFDAPEGSSLWGLLTVIALNKVRRKSTRAKSVDAGPLTAVDDQDPVAQLEDGSLIAEQFEALIRESIEGLKAGEQEIVLLRIQGFTVEEISDQLNRSVRTIERSLQKIREKLADVLLLDLHEE